MLETDREIDHPPSSHAVRNLRTIKAAGEPLVLVINERIRLSIDDETSYQKLEELVDWLDCVAYLRERVRDFEAGKKAVTLEEAKEEARKKYGIPL